MDEIPFDFELINDSGIVKTVHCNYCGQDITGTIIDIAFHIGSHSDMDSIPDSVTIKPNDNDISQTDSK